MFFHLVVSLLSRDNICSYCPAGYYAPVPLFQPQLLFQVLYIKNGFSALIRVRNCSPDDSGLTELLNGNRWTVHRQSDAHDP